MKQDRRIISTSQAEIAVLDSRGSGMPVVFIHGNSSSKDVFAQQLASFDDSRYRLIAIDLPGHGESQHAVSDETYSISGYADVVQDVLRQLGVDRHAVIGWSLGGHVGIELLGRGANMCGLMLIGSPPFGRGILAVARAFHMSYDLLLATKGRLGPHEARRFGKACLGNALEPRFIETILRTDGRARPALLRSMIKSDGLDQRHVVESAECPIAIVNGAEEPFARLDYLAGLHYGHLWDGRCQVINGAGHAPFLEQPTQFNAILDRFLGDVCCQTNVAPIERVTRRSA